MFDATLAAEERATLIAKGRRVRDAAPELLEALKQMAGLYATELEAKGSILGWTPVNKARDAIAKAEGE